MAATTYKDVVDEVVNTLHGVVGDLEQATELTQSITTSSLSFTVDDATQVSRGLVEIGDELMWVKKVDASASTVALNSWGRGYRQTAAAAHSSAAMVLNSPMFPRALVKATIQETLSAIYPELFVVKTDETNTSVATTITYPVPAAADWIQNIEWSSIGPTKRWVPVKRWRFSPTADTTAFPTGKSVDLFDSIVPGRSIKITYGGAGSALVNDTDTLTSTGYGENIRDVLVYGAAWRLLMGVEAGRLGTEAVEQSDRDQLVQVGAAANAAKTYLTMFQLRLQDERQRLLQLYPSVTHMTR